MSIEIYLRRLDSDENEKVIRLSDHEAEVANLKAMLTCSEKKLALAVDCITDIAAGCYDGDTAYRKATETLAKIRGEGEKQMSIKFYDSMGFESDHGIYARRADHEAEVAAYKTELTRILSNGDLAWELINSLEKKLAAAVEVVRALAEWSEKYPRQQIHSFNEKVDEQLVSIEKMAVEALAKILGDGGEKV